MTLSIRIGAAAAIALAAPGAGAQALVNERSISLDAALELASAWLQRCRAAQAGIDNIARGLGG